MREANGAEADQVTADMRQELDEMNLARQRIRQARQLSKNLYKEETGSRLSGFA
jgi:hypothetical protein